MTDIDRIKRAVSITTLVGSKFELDGRHGKRMRSTIPHDSLIINTANDTYTWYSKSSANGRAEHGDIFDFTGRHLLNYGDSWHSANPAMFKESLGYLSKFAGLPEPVFKPEDATARAQRLNAEQIMDRAAKYYRAQFEQSQAAQHYAAGRGFTADTIARACLGYTGGDPADLPEDKPKYGRGLVDDLPPADHAAAAELGIIRTGEAGYYDAIPLGYLVYPHFQHGRVVYFSGRSIYTNSQKLKSRNQSGAKKVFWATWPGQRGPLAIFEGQADALSAAQLGISALGLCGVNMADLDIDQLEMFGPIFYWADADQAGRQAVDALGRAIGPLLRLPSPPVYHLDKSPVKDFNDLLKLGFTADQAFYWQNQAVTYLDYEIDRLIGLGGPERDAGLTGLFALLVRLDNFQRLRYRQIVCDRLGITRGDFSDFMRLAKGDDESAATIRRAELFDVVEGSTIIYQYDQKTGKTTANYLADANFRINELIIYDNGSGDSRREYALSGKTARGVNLAANTVPTSEFETLKWVAEHYPHVIIGAGRSTKDLLREAIQHLSGEYPYRTIYEHTGWRKIGDQICYLTAGGALGLPPSSQEKVEVNLKLGRENTHLVGYNLPLQPQNVAEAVRASLNMWHITDNPAVEVPIWAAAWLSPLSPFLAADFGLWVYGKTNSYKSVRATLSQAHFGEYWRGRNGNLKLPSNFISTVNNIAMDAFIVKDALLVVDDYAPGNTERERRERDEVASRLLRSLGNKAARGRMRDGRRYQADFPPRCLAVITAEDLPPGQSILARALGVRVPTLPPQGTTTRDQIDRRLCRAQDDEAPLYPQAMAAYILWIQRHWAELEKQLPLALVDNHKQFTAAGYARLADAMAKMMTAIDTALFFALDAGAITDSQSADYQATARQALQSIMSEHSGQIDALDPIKIFIETLREQIDSRDWYLESKDFKEPATTTDGPPSPAISDEWKRRAWCCGWHDKTYIYLLPKAINHIIELYSRRGTPFPISRTTLENRLSEQGILHKKTTTFIQTIDTSPWVLWLLRNAVYPPKEE
jgi:hypothetical protein